MPVLENSRRERFAQLVATGNNATQAYILAGYSKTGANRGAHRLLSNVDIQARVKELKSAIAAEVVQLAVSDRNQRLALLQEIVDARRTIFKERASHPDNQSTPGGRTGRMVKTLKMIGGGENAITVEEWEVDNQSDREMREALKNAAIECGDWFEHEKAPAVAGPSVTVNLIRADLRGLGGDRLKSLLGLVHDVAAADLREPSGQSTDGR